VSDEASARSLSAYSALVREYHSTLDLISPAGLENWEQLLADAASYGDVIAELAPGSGTVLDVGSGSGLPGVPLALRFPERRIVLSERRRRRTAFLNIVRGQLALDNVDVHGGDVAELTGLVAPVITAQAVSDFASIYELTCRLQAAEVLLVSSKGSDWQEEAEQLEQRSGTSAIRSAVRARAHGQGCIVGLVLAGGQQCR